MEPLLGKQSFGTISAQDPIDDPVIITSLHGAFPGSIVPAARIEGLIAAHVPIKHIQDVSDVYAHKWWDYRRLSPGHSFMLFATCYYKAFRLAARTFLAHRKREGRKIGLVGVGELQYKAEEIWDRDAAHITGMWKAMLMADALGIPYDRFCQLAFQVATDTAWNRLPRPSQLYSEKMAAMVLQAWMDLRKDRMILARHPIYKIENYADTQLQNDYRQWAIQELKDMDSPLAGLSAAVYSIRQIPEDMASQHFPQPLMNRARLLAA